MLQAVGTKPLKTYIDKRKAKLVEWVALRPIFDICTKETGYEGGGDGVWDKWWRQAAAEQHLKAMLKEILEAERDRQQQEFGRYGGVDGVEEESYYGSER